MLKNNMQNKLKNNCVSCHNSIKTTHAKMQHNYDMRGNYCGHCNGVADTEVRKDIAVLQERARIGEVKEVKK